MNPRQPMVGRPLAIAALGLGALLWILPHGALGQAAEEPQQAASDRASAAIDDTEPTDTGSQTAPPAGPAGEAQAEQGEGPAGTTSSAPSATAPGAETVQTSAAAGQAVEVEQATGVAPPQKKEPSAGGAARAQEARPAAGARVAPRSGGAAQARGSMPGRSALDLERHRPGSGRAGGSTEDDPAADRSLEQALLRQGRIALRAHGGVSVHRDPSMELYTTDETLNARGVGVGLDVYRTGALALAVDADWMYERASSKRVLGGGFNSWYTQHLGTLGLGLRYDLRSLHPWLRLVAPHLRVFAAMAATKQRLNENRQRLSYQTPYERTFGAGLAAGFTLRTPGVAVIPGSDLFALSLGLRFEVGYTVMDDPELAIETFDDSPHAIPIHGASLGHLELDAPFVRASAELRF